MKKILYFALIPFLLLTTELQSQNDTIRVSKRKIYYQGEKINGKELLDVLKSVNDPEVSRLLSSYNTTNTIGYVVSAGGLVMMGVGEAMDLADPIETNGLGLLVGGAGVMLGGGLISLAGNTSMKKAIQRYNDVILGRTGETGQSPVLPEPPVSGDTISDQVPPVPSVPPTEKKSITLSVELAGDDKSSTCPLHKGAYLVHTSTDLSLGSNKRTNLYNSEITSESKMSTFNLMVQGGKFLSREFVVGGTLGIASSSSKISETHKVKSLMFRLGSYGRAYLPLEGKIQPFTDLSLVLGVGGLTDKYENPDFNNTKGLGFFGLGFGVGASLFFSDRFALDVKFAYDLESNALSEEDYSSGNVNRFLGIQTGFNFLLK